MQKELSTPIEEACHFRYPAWTLYARAFSGSRDHADRIVRGVVTEAMRRSRALATEAEAHDHVLREIRASALAYNERHTHRGGDAAGQRQSQSQSQSQSHSRASVLRTLRAQAHTEPSRARRLSDSLREHLEQLPREQRRIVDMLLLRRRPLSIRQVAQKRRTEASAVSAVLTDALRTLATGLRGSSSMHGLDLDVPKSHVDTGSMTSYVNGALSGDEALDVIAHCEACTKCGDELGVMMLLRSNVAAKVRLPVISRESRIAALVVLVVATTLGGAFAFQALRPNPWAEHATSAPVPEWFHQFFYGGDRKSADSELSAALLLLVQEDYERAIEKLEPLLERPGTGTGTNVDAAAYLGIARYLTGNVSRRTVDLLEEGTRSHRSGRLARWYLASTHLARRDIDGAREQLEALTKVRDWFGRAADALLERLEEVDRHRDGVTNDAAAVAANGDGDGDG